MDPPLSAFALALKSGVPIRQRVQQTFYKRELPADLISYTSARGQEVFRKALAENAMAAFFPISSQAMTQNEPAYCGLASLAMVLNALEVDPMRAWKGPWRWYSEELLDCCTDLETVKKEGISADKLACLAKCNGLRCERVMANNSNLDAFRMALRESCERADRPMIVQFDRQMLGQSGTGHFSPIAGYCPSEDLALVWEPARFKYAPFWVSVPTLWAAVNTPESDSEQLRSYFLLARKTRGDRPHEVCSCCVVLSDLPGDVLETLLGPEDTSSGLQVVGPPEVIAAAGSADASSSSSSSSPRACGHSGIGPCHHCGKP